MRYAHTVEQVRAAEHALMATLPEGTLMQRAAFGLATAVSDFLGGVYGARICLLVGSGDNGGDALYAGALLARRGASVEAWLLGGRAHEAGVAALKAAGGRVGRSCAESGEADVVIDGITGIGGQPGLRAEAVTALEALAGVPIVAVDVPSGVGVDTGQLDGPHVTAALTVTMGTHKIAHLVDPAARAAGVVHLVDIGLDLPEAPIEALQETDVAALLPRPDLNAQKYTRGVVGLRTGSALYPGAALLSVSGANTGLAGMVRYVGDPGVAARIKLQHPEVVGDGRCQAWVVGCGTGDQAERDLEMTVAQAGVDSAAVVVDADALAFVTGPLGVLAVLTPHAGELAGMLGVERAEIEAAPLRFVREASDRYAATVLLKGRHTLVAAPGRPVRVTTSAPPWLATAGAGDVLAGLVGSLLAAGLEPFDAASVGSWLHGAAATLAAQGGPIVATDITRAIPEAVRRAFAA